MAKLLLVANHTFVNPEDSTNPTITFSDVVKVNVKQSIEPKSNYCEVTLKNPIYQRLSDKSLINKYIKTNKEIKFSQGDTLKIYAARLKQNRDIDTSATSQDLIMSAYLEEVKVKGEAKSSQITIRCVDKTYVVLNKLWTYNYSDDTKPAGSSGWTPPMIIQDVIRKVTDMGDDYAGYDSIGTAGAYYPFAIDARFTSVGGFIEDTRPGGSAFPTVTMAKVWKPAYEFIKDLSTPQMTNGTAELANPATLPINRNMIFYVDEQNKFHWFYPRDSAETTITAAINATVTTIAIASITGFNTLGGRAYIESEVIEYAAISGLSLTGCTRGMNGTPSASHASGATIRNGLTIIEGDTTSGNELLSFDMTKKTFDIVNMVIFNAGLDFYGSGTLWYYYDINTQDKDLKMVYKPYTDITKTLIQAEILAGHITAATAGQFGYQGKNYSPIAYNFTTSWGDTVSSDSTYNKSLRNKAAFNADSDGIKRASALTRLTGNPRWKGTITMNGFRYKPGDLVIFTSNRAGIQKKDLFINEVSHDISKDSWTTTIDAQENEVITGS